MPSPFALRVSIWNKAQVKCDMKSIRVVLLRGGQHNPQALFHLNQNVKLHTVCVMKSSPKAREITADLANALTKANIDLHGNPLRQLEE